MTISIPKTIAEVDKAWMSQVVGTPVTDLQLTQIGQGVGIMGDIFRVTLTLAEPGQGPASVVVKLPSSFEENRQQGVALGMFEAEVRFYNELAGEVPVGLPQIYFADIAADGAQFVIVMEDLSAMRMVEQHIGMTGEEAKAAVEVLARVHAVWWGRAQVEALDWIPSMIGPRIEFVDQMLTQMLPTFLSGFAQYLPDGGVAVYENFAGNYLNINTVIAGRSPWTVTHQDYRVENLLFSDERVVILDWQGIGRGPGAYDLAYILSGSMDTETRRACEPELLDHYLATLQDGGVSGYSAEQLADDYGLAQMMGGLATAMFTGGGMDLSNERGVQLVATMARRHVTAALDHNGLERLKEIVG